MIFLVDYLTFGKEFGASAYNMELVQNELEICTRFLCTQEYANAIGVMVNEPEGNYPFAPCRVQSWRGCATAATGFAGLSLAQVIQAKTIYSVC